MDMVKETISREKTHIFQSLFPWVLYDMILIEAVKWNLILLFLSPWSVGVRRRRAAHNSELSSMISCMVCDHVYRARETTSVLSLGSSSQMT